MNIAIIEDLEADQIWLSNKIKQYMDERRLSYMIHEFTCAEDFIHSLASNSYSIVFMDIYLEQMNGMDAAYKLREYDKDCKLVFLTATPDFSLQGYSVRASHYLVKPVSDEKFMESMENCRIAPQYAVPYLDLSSYGGPARLDTSQIQYMHLQGRTVHIHTNQQIFSVTQPFSRVTESLTADKRFLISIQGVMVNMDYISGHEDSFFILKNGDRVPINLRNKKRVLQQYRNYIFEHMEAL